MLALAIFVYGVIVTGDVREIEPSGPSGLGAAQTAQVGVKGLPAARRSRAPSRRPARSRSRAPSRPRRPLQIDAIAQQWLWRFEYPGGEPGQRTFSYGELVVPVDTTVILNITSTDVLHSWWVPALGGQVQAAPGDVVQTWFKADEVGRYEGRSTIFSGTGYPAMRAWVRVVSVPEYEAYVEQLAADLTEAQGIVLEEQEAADETRRDGGRRTPVSPPTASQPGPRSSPAASRAERPAWIERATSADHKMVGLLYIATALSLPRRSRRSSSRSCACS